MPSRTRSVTAASPASAVRGSSAAIGLRIGAVPTERIEEVVGDPHRIEPELFRAVAPTSAIASNVIGADRRARRTRSAAGSARIACGQDTHGARSRRRRAVYGTRRGRRARVAIAPRITTCATRIAHDDRVVTRRGPGRTPPHTIPAPRGVEPPRSGRPTSNAPSGPRSRHGERHVVASPRAARRSRARSAMSMIEGETSVSALPLLRRRGSTGRACRGTPRPPGRRTRPSRQVRGSFYGRALLAERRDAVPPRPSARPGRP